MRIKVGQRKQTLRRVSSCVVFNTAPASVVNCKCSSFALVIEFAWQILIINSDLNSFVMQMTHR